MSVARFPLLGTRSQFSAKHLSAEVQAQLRSLEAKLEFAERVKFQAKGKGVLNTIFAEHQAILASYNGEVAEFSSKVD